MADLNIQELDPKIEAALSLRASKNGRSVESEAKAILERAISVDAEQEIDLAEAIRLRFADLGGADDLVAALDRLEREPLTLDR